MTAEAKQRQVFEELTLPLMKPLYNKAYRLAQNAADASDIVQDTYLRAYRTFENFETGTNAKAWMFTILYSVFVNRYRKERRRPQSLSLDEAEETGNPGVQAVDWQASADILEQAETDWKEPEVTEALDALPEEFRVPLLLVDVEQLSYEEAAAVIECPVGTVRSRLYRGRRHLAVHLRDYAIKSGILRQTGKEQKSVVG